MRHIATSFKVFIALFVQVVVNAYIIIGVQVLWDVTPCLWVGRSQRFVVSCGLHREVQTVQQVFAWTAHKFQPVNVA